MKVDSNSKPIHFPLQLIKVQFPSLEAILNGACSVTCRFAVDLIPNECNQLNAIEFDQMNTEEADTT